MNWCEYFYYDESSPSGLRWLINAGKRRQSGDIAGTVCHGAWRVQVEGVVYMVHRVVYEMHYGNLDNLHVDHIDRNPSNNCVENLRAVKHKVNMRNKSRQENNTSGVAGISYKTVFDKRYDTVYTGWLAQWRGLNSERQSKFFSVEKHGYDQAFQLACEHRVKMIAELNEQGAGYSSTHGK